MARTKAVEAKKKAIRGVNLAKALVSGATVKQVATAAGVSRTAVYKDLASPETAYSLRAIYRKNEEELDRLFGRALKAIDDAFGATKTYSLPETGVLVATSKPDHLARLKAVAELRHILLVGREHASGPGESRALPTYEEVQAWIVQTQLPA